MNMVDGTVRVSYRLLSFNSNLKRFEDKKER